MVSIDERGEAPWRVRFAADEILWAAVAAKNEARGVVATNRGGLTQIYAWDVATGELRQLTDRERGQTQAAISADGRWVYYLNDERGNEIGHYVRLPFEGGEVEDLTPQLPPYATFGITQSGSGRWLGFVGAAAAAFRLYVAPLDEEGRPSEWRELWRAAALSVGPFFSNEGDLVAVQTTAGADQLEFSIEVLETGSGEVIGRLREPGVSYMAARFAPGAGDGRLLCTSSAGGYRRPFLWDPRSGERTAIGLPADLDGDVYPWDWSADGARLLLCQVAQAAQQLWVYDLASGVAVRLVHPPGSYAYRDEGYFTGEGEIFVTWQDANHSSRLVALDAQIGRLSRTVLAPREVPAGRPWRSVTFPSAEGVVIQGWVATPAGDGPFPTILHTHGGPTSVQTEVFMPESQAWLDHGFAFMSINYRGSITFGKPFEEAIWGKLGTVEVDDMAAARDWLVDSGIARPDAVFLTGGSYGGFLTLQGLGRRPELWAGGMAFVAVADWRLMYEDQAETLRGYQRALFGGSPEEKPEAHAAASPITYAEQVRAPILVIQGANDTRCPARQLRAYESRLRELGKEIEVHWFDAGHGSYDDKQKIEFMELKLDFAWRVLGEI